jgi:hypothetical protein
LGIGDWGLGPIPNPQSPIPNPHPQISVLFIIIISFNNYFKIYVIFNLNLKIKQKWDKMSKSRVINITFI